MTPFQQKVYAVIRTIPAGEVLTYKQVAQLIGSPRAFRAVGNALNKNYDPEIPCHRVIKSSGETGGYNRGVKKKRIILEQEGAVLSQNKIPDTKKPS